MCGIVGGIGEPSDAAVAALRHRGPDGSGLVRLHGSWLGHTRLSVQDVSSASAQPFGVGDVRLTYNGELWNHAELRRELQGLGRRFRTTGDTEVFAAALDQWGVEALPRMQGMFAAAWVASDGILRLARDRHGEVPLHVFMARPFSFASELKALIAMGLNPGGFGWVPPGQVWEVTRDRVEVKTWYQVPVGEFRGDRGLAMDAVRRGVEGGSLERTVSDVPVCTLLSGGIDSAAVAAHLASRLPGLVAYTAVMSERSPDLRAAREVAEHLGIELREVPVAAPSADDLAEVVRVIEMPHKAQVEIGWACLQLARRMREDGFKVTFSGEGSDELWASYGMSYHGVRKLGWRGYREKLFGDQHRKNFARCNKVFMAAGIECRLPFLSTDLVEVALSLPMDLVQDGRSRPKAVLQDSHADLLPASIVRRQKLAFQDGLGLKPECERAVSDPRRFYDHVFRGLYGS